jgi:hypothetical protein
MAQAKAIQTGFYGGSLRQAGAVFEIDDGATGSWFEVVEGSEEKPAKPRAQKAKGSGPQSFSELAKQDAKDLAPKGVDGSQQ